MKMLKLSMAMAALVMAMSSFAEKVTLQYHVSQGADFEVPVKKEIVIEKGPQAFADFITEVAKAEKIDPKAITITFDYPPTSPYSLDISGIDITNPLMIPIHWLRIIDDPVKAFAEGANIGIKIPSAEDKAAEEARHEAQLKEDRKAEQEKSRKQAEELARQAAEEAARKAAEEAARKAELEAFIKPVQVSAIPTRVAAVSVGHNPNWYDKANNPNGRKEDEDAFDIKRATPAYPQESFGVYDGHYGKEMALYAKDHLLNNVNANFAHVADLDKNGALIAYAREMLTPGGNDTLLKDFNAKFAAMTPEEKALLFALLETDKEAKDKVGESGSTVVAAVIKDNTLYAGLLADARAVVADKDGNVLWRTIDQSIQADGGNMKKDELTKDKRRLDWPVREMERIEAAGGRIGGVGINNRRILKDSVGRDMAVSRTLGDFAFRNALIAVPDIYTYILTSDAKYLILACDGVWDVMSSEEAAKNVADFLRGKPGTQADAMAAAENLVQTAKDKGSTDNITAMVIVLKPLK